jgi:hypothetical protein
MNLIQLRFCLYSSSSSNEKKMESKMHAKSNCYKFAFKNSIFISVLHPFLQKKFLLLRPFQKGVKSTQKK